MAQQPDFAAIQKLIASMDENSTAERLMEQNPDMDPAAILAQQPQGGLGDITGALAGAQSGQQPPNVQLPPPRLFGFGEATKTPNSINLPGAPQPQGFGHLMFGGR